MIVNLAMFMTLLSPAIYNAERTTTDAANSVHQTSVLQGIREPVYEETQRGWPQQDWKNTLTELLNPMYDTTTLQQIEEPGYQETQREVKNILYGELKTKTET